MNARAFPGLPMVLTLLLGLLSLPSGLAAEEKPDGPAPTAEALLARSIDYHDPEGRFLTRAHRLSFKETRPNGPDRLTTIVIDVPREYFLRAVEGPPKTAQLLDSEGCSLSVAGRPPTEEEIEEHGLTCDRTRMLRNYYTYLWGLPMKLRDPGTNLGPVKAATFDGKPAWEMRVTYDEGVGGDIWYVYFDPATAAMIGYRFYHDEAAGDGEVIVLSGEVEAAGLRLPAERAWTTHQDERYLGTDVLVKLEEGR